MKTNVKLIDALPTVFGLVATAGVVLFYTTRHAASDGLLSTVALMISGGVVFTFLASLLSILVAFARHSFKSEPTPNVVWLNLVWLCATIVAYSWYSASWEHFGGG